MFEHAPPPVMVGDRSVVPMHLRALAASVVMDCRARTGFVEALLTYEVGPNGGHPFFDLRQDIDKAWLDGRSLDVAAVASREVGAGPSGSVRVIEVSQAPRSLHTLRLRYRLGTPRSDLGGAYPPVLTWTRDGRARWSLGMADLYAGRHLEAWFPSNLPFDQFPFTLALRLVGTAVTHSLITNGVAATRGTNGWSVGFPAWFTGMSPLVEVRAASDLQKAQGSASLPISGRTVAIEVWKPTAGPENLPAAVRRIAQLLAENESRFGAFPGDRYVALFHGASGGMEYANATTTSEEALAHEVMHSWFARGVTPASHADGWWDEAFTTYRTGGGPLSVPFDYTARPVRLCSRRPFQRRTPPESYTEGSRFFRGVAAVVGPAALDHLMRSLYEANRRRPLATPTLEEHLVAGSGAVGLVDAFHRFVYGLADPVDVPRLRFTTGAPEEPGSAGRSQEAARALWLRHRRDGLSGHQVPRAHEGSWIHARVTNDATAQRCRHFVVVFAVRPASARPPRYPDDFLRAGPIAAAAGFDLPPGRSSVLSAMCPRPFAGTHTPVEVLASLHARRLHPAAGGVVDTQQILCRRLVELPGSAGVEAVR